MSSMAVCSLLVIGACLWCLVALWISSEASRKTGRGRFAYSIGPVENKRADDWMIPGAGIMNYLPPKGVCCMLELKITNEQKIHVGVNPVTATGKASALDGPIKATVVSGDATTVVDDDGKGVTLISPDNPGDSQVLIEADADLGDGVETISDIIKLTVAGAKAVSLGLVAGDPQPK